MSVDNSQSSKIGIRIIASLALIALLGPLSVDIYLAAMPQMTQDLHTDYATMQLTLTVFLLALGGGQLIFGPLVDALGRKKPLLTGILVFIAASLWAAASTSMDALLAARFIQGLSTSLVLVTAMSSVRDVANGAQATQLYALLITIQGIVPILAPAGGGLIDAHFGWRMIMLTLAGVGAIALLNSSINLPETLAVEKRTPLRLKDVFQTYWRLLKDGKFILPAIALACVFFFLFGYIGGAAYVYQTGYGLRSDIFGFVFGATGTSMMLGAMASSHFAQKVPTNRMALAGAAIMCIGSIIALLASFTGAGLYGVVAGLFIAIFGLGITEPVLMSVAMASQERSLGTAAALLGAGTNILGSLATPIAGALAPVGAHAWLGFLATVALLTLVTAYLATHKLKHKMVAAH